jgi:hypothetical protein
MQPAGGPSAGAEVGFGSPGQDFGQSFGSPDFSGMQPAGGQVAGAELGNTFGSLEFGGVQPGTSPAETGMLASLAGPSNVNAGIGIMGPSQDMPVAGMAVDLNFGITDQQIAAENRGFSPQSSPPLENMNMTPPTDLMTPSTQMAVSTPQDIAQQAAVSQSMAIAAQAAMDRAASDQALSGMQPAGGFPAGAYAADPGARGAPGEFGQTQAEQSQQSLDQQLGVPNNPADMQPAAYGTPQEMATPSYSVTPGPFAEQEINAPQAPQSTPFSVPSSPPLGSRADDYPPFDLTPYASVFSTPQQGPIPSDYPQNPADIDRALAAIAPAVPNNPMDMQPPSYGFPSVNEMPALDPGTISNSQFGIGAFPGWETVATPSFSQTNPPAGWAVGLGLPAPSQGFPPVAGPVPSDYPQNPADIDRALAAMPSVTPGRSDFPAITPSEQIGRAFESPNLNPSQTQPTSQQVVQGPTQLAPQDIQIAPVQAPPPGPYETPQQAFDRVAVSERGRGQVGPEQFDLLSPTPLDTPQEFTPPAAQIGRGQQQAPQEQQQPAPQEQQQQQPPQEQQQQQPPQEQQQQQPPQEQQQQQPPQEQQQPAPEPGPPGRGPQGPPSQTGITPGGPLAGTPTGGLLGALTGAVAPAGAPAGLGGTNDAIRLLSGIAQQNPQAAQQIAQQAQQVAQALGIPVELALQIILQALQRQQATQGAGR